MADRQSQRPSRFIEDIVRETAGAFSAIYSAQDGIDAMLRGDDTWIRSQLPTGLKKQVPVVNYDYGQDLDLEVGNLARPNEIHIEPASNLQRHETSSDVLEDILANWLVKLGLGPGSWLWNTIYAGLCHNFYVPVWLEQSDYAPPQQGQKESNPDYNKRVDRYNRAFFPWKLIVDPVKAVSFLDYQNEITLGCRDIEIPIINLAEYTDGYTYDQSRSREDDTRLRLEVCRQEFKGYRAADGTAVDDATPFSKRIKVKVVDDGYLITHHIENDGEYMEVSDYKNPFGRVSLQVLAGHFEATRALSERRLPFHRPLLRKYQEIMMADSLIASYAASAATAMGMMLPPGPAEKYMDIVRNQEPLPEIDLDSPMPTFIGPVASYLGMSEQINLELERRKLMAQELQILRPTSLFNSPDAGSTVEYAKASAVLHASEELSKRLTGPINSASAFVKDTCLMMLEGWHNSTNSHYQKGSYEEDKKLDVPLSATLTGSERVFGRVVTKGSERSLSPAKADFDFTLEVVSRDERLSTQAANRAEAQALWNTIDGVPLITFDQYISRATGLTNISEQKRLLLKDRVTQMNMPAKMEKTGELVTQYLAQFLGTDPMLMSIQQDVQIDPNAPSPSAGGANGSNAGQRMQSPGTELPEGQAQG